MASVFNRGTKDRPNWYGQYKDVTGKFRMVPTKKSTRRDALAFAEDLEVKAQEGIAVNLKPKPLRDLAETWLASLRNRNADEDRSRCRRHLLPALGHYTLPQIDIARVLFWIDAMRAGTAPTAAAPKTRGRRVEKLSESSMRSNLNLLSRFFSWAVEGGHAPMNPVRQIPTGRRPHPPINADQPWIEDDAMVRRLLHELPEPVDLMFYLGNRSGLRVGEICGLRLSDLGFLSEGLIRVRYSYDGPLKEDKRREGKSKFVPAPDDAEELLADWLIARRHAGAGPEDLVFPPPERKTKKGDPWPRSATPEARKQLVEDAWLAARKRLGLALTFYQATRHSFVSRSLARGASLDEVSAAVGHSSPMVTRRYYDHFVRKSYSAQLRQGLGLATMSAAPVLTIGRLPRS